MNPTEKMVRDLSDEQIVGVTNEFFRSAYRQVEYETVRKNAADVAELGQLTTLPEGALRRELSDEASIRLGRALLEQCAGDPAYEPLVEDACQKVRESDKLVVGTILAIGAVVNLTLLVASTRFKWKRTPDGKSTVEIAKTRVRPELLKAVVDPVVDAVKATVG